MKKSFLNYVVGGALFLSAPMLTSCQDILGEWDKPTPVNTDAGGGGSTEGVAYVKYTVSGITATPSNETATEYTEWTGTISPSSISGTYVVTGTATCTGDLTLAGDVNIILSDGASMTITGKIVGDDGSYTYPYSLNIYGQSSNTGEFIVNTSDAEHGIEAKNISIHGGQVTASNTTALGGQAIFAFSNLYIYGGNVTADSPNSQAIMVNGGAFDVYNATVTATSTSGYSIISNAGTTTFYSGTITATGGATSTNGIDANISVYNASVTATAGTEGISGTITNSSTEDITYDTYNGTAWTANAGTITAGNSTGAALGVKGVRF